MKFIRIPLTEADDEMELIFFSTPRVNQPQPNYYLYAEDGIPLAYNRYVKDMHDIQSD